MERITKLHNMKNLTFVGIILLAIGVLLFYLNNMALDLRVVYGALCGIGVGLIFGGIVGYVSKGSAVKQENKMRQFKQLQKEKDELEKKQAQLMQDATQNKKNKAGMYNNPAFILLVSKVSLELVSKTNHEETWSVVIVYTITCNIVDELTLVFRERTFITSIYNQFRDFTFAPN